MRTRRTFSNEFKRQVVEEILSGGTFTAAACRKYAIAYPVIVTCPPKTGPDVMLESGGKLHREAG